MITYTIYIGSDRYISHSFAPDTHLQTIRATLGAQISNNMRFVNYQATATFYSDMIVSLTDEPYLPVSKVVGLKNQLYLTDVRTTVNTDLIGFRNPWFWDRKLGVRVEFNTESAAMLSNKNKMPPLMLTNVKLANPHLKGVGAMQNVLVCEKGSLIQFLLNSSGAVAYGYDIRPMAGPPIMDNSLYICFQSYAPTNRSIGVLQKYYTPNNSSTNNKMIQVVPTSSLNLGNGTTLSYMKFSVKTWNVYSYTTQNNKVHSSIKFPFLASAIQPGTTIPSLKPSGQPFNGPIHNIIEDKTAKGILGEVVFYVFVFDNHADAIKTFTSINTPDQSLWVV